MEGSEISEDVALSMAVNAYNQMEMKSGYSPAFLVYNIGTTFPSILDMSPPQLESVVDELPRSLGDAMKAREEALKNHLEIKMTNS